eukprot:1136045-Rhodomonas_salina.1
MMLIRISTPPPMLLSIPRFLSSSDGCLIGTLKLTLVNLCQIRSRHGRSGHVTGVFAVLSRSCRVRHTRVIIQANVSRKRRGEECSWRVE